MERIQMPPHTWAWQIIPPLGDNSVYPTSQGAETSFGLGASQNTLCSVRQIFMEARMEHHRRGSMLPAWGPPRLTSLAYLRRNPLRRAPNLAWITAAPRLHMPIA